MTKRWDLRNEFARVYCSAAADTSLPATQTASAYAKSLRIIVVDALQLTDGTQRFIETWTLPGTSGIPRATANRATLTSTTPLMVGLHHATIGETTSHVAPAYSGRDAIEWTAWHQGNLLEITAAGSVEAVLHYCDVTENERERITMKARAMSRSGRIVFATATGTSHDTEPSYGTLNFDGLIVCELDLLPGTRDAVARLRHASIRLVYVTAAPEDVAIYIAHAAGITDHPKSGRHGDFVTSPDHDIYASVTRVNARRIISALPQPLLVVQHPISDVAHMLEAYS